MLMNYITLSVGGFSTIAYTHRMRRQRDTNRQTIWEKRNESIQMLNNEVIMWQISERYQFYCQVRICFRKQDNVYLGGSLW